MTVNPAEMLKSYQDKGYNILTPYVSLDNLGKNWRATVKTIMLSSDIKDGDVYPKKGDPGRFIITKQGLDRLSVLANIVWKETRRSDDEKNDNYMKMEAQGALRLADGSLSPDTRTYDIDLDAKEESLRYDFVEKGRKANKSGEALDDYVNYCVGRELRRIRNHRVTLCESGAKNRVIRALLGIRLYSKEHLKNPFVCITIAYKPDEEDPIIKQLLTLQSMGALSAVYGMPQPIALPPPDETQYISAPEEDEIASEENGSAIDEAEAEYHENEPVEDDFDNWDRRSQEAFVSKLASKKNYSLAGLLGRWEPPKDSLGDLTEVQLMTIKDKLATMKTVKGQDDDDIPW